MRIVEKHHRLPEERYWGQKTVSFTACMLNRRRFFTSPDRVQPCVDFLSAAVSEFECIATIYCFMPDHLHVLIKGMKPSARPKEAMDSFKGRSGQWLAENHPTFHWQKDYYDHIIRGSEDWSEHAKYVLLNPVRANLVDDPFKYPFTGCIGVKLEDVFWDIWGL